MIKVTLTRNNNKYIKIELYGHANYGKLGKDIVCSGISSIVTTTVNAIIRFDSKYIEYKNNKDLFLIEIIEHNDITNTLIENMISMLHEIQNDYPNNIKIEEEDL